MNLHTKVILSMALSAAVMISPMIVTLSGSSNPSPVSSTNPFGTPSIQAGNPVELLKGNVSGSHTPQVMGNVSLGFSGPLGLAYDPSNGNIYMSNSGSNRVSVINGTSNQVMENITVGNEPGYMAYDPFSGELLVIENSNIAVINTTTNLLSSHLLEGQNASYISFDGRNGCFYISYSTSADNNGYILVLNGSDNSVVAKITSVLGPYASMADGNNGYVYVSYYSFNQGVAIINDTTNKLVREYSFGDAADMAVYDPDNNRVYLANGNRVTVFNGSSNNITGNFTVASNLLSIAYDSSSGTIYLTDLSTSNIFVYESSTNTLLKKLYVGGNPNGIIFDSSNGLLYVADPPYSVAVINGLDNSVREVMTLGSYPNAITYSRTSDEIYVANLDSSRIMAINGTSDRLDSYIGVGAYPSEISTAYPGNNIFVSDSYNNQVSVINARSDRVVATTGVENSPQGISYDSANDRVYVLDLNGNGISVLNGTTGKLLYNFSVGFSQLTYVFPYESTWDSLNHNLYINFDRNNFVSEINTTVNSQVANIPVGTETQDLVTDTWNGNVYITCPATNSVAVLNTSTLVISDTIPVGESPGAITFDPYTGFLYVANTNSNSVSVINGATNSVTANLSVGQYPSAMAFDYSNGYVYVANQYSNNLTILGNPDYKAIFNEKGLGSGPWFINITGPETIFSEQISASSHTFNIPYGVYQYVISAGNSNYLPDNSSRLFFVNNTTVHVGVTFHAKHNFLTSNFLIYAGTTAIIIGALVAGVASYVRRKRN